MGRFHFKLEAVLGYRRTVEEQRLRALAAVQAELAACGARLDALRAERSQTLDEWPTRVDVIDAGRREAYLASLCARIEGEERVRESIEERLSVARAALLAARQAAEALETLRERALDAHRRDALLREQAALDEAAVLRHARAAAADGRGS
ncbi:MAG: flagellar export protein FliJ [Chthonomonadales bacterium]|nr:flagellar export protein FliJ [Chthonomonadales bacterium]